MTSVGVGYCLRKWFWKSTQVGQHEDNDNGPNKITTHTGIDKCVRHV